ncbi:hypothetical protein GCM10010411_47940 [Actinomadura fulvescens]|uniref:SGNH hydrolase-type esterase domain-containing protein n=2 Tax=Actinomadura fulvescens TaxID=46160 RepID=A0ABP6CCD2_9ACTN
MSKSIYVAIGDSLTAGKGDRDPEGRPIGWALRLSRLLTARTGTPFEFVNRAVNRATIADVLAVQVPGLAASHPDLITVSIGINDIRGSFQREAFARGVDEVFGVAAATGATVATMTLPDIVSMLPLPAELLPMAKELMEQANAAIRDAADAHGVLYVDAWYADEVAEPAFWSEDRVHPNASGHTLIAEAFADLLEASSTLAGVGKR